MIRFKQKFFLKLPLALVLAFLGSQLLVTKVTYKEIPVVRPSFRIAIQNLPLKITTQIKKVAHRSKEVLPSRQLPPPWIEPEVKPTIIVYKPPAYTPPTSTPKPTSPPPTATPLPTQPPGQPPLTPPPILTPTPLPSPTPLPTQPPELPPSQKKAQLLNIINQERQKNGIASLGYNSALDQAAQEHAEDMIKNNYFSHTGRDGSTPADRAIRAGYSTGWVGENIAKGSTSPSQIFSMWMGSSGHRQNMLNPAWKSAGVGVASTIWVLLLGAK